MTGAAGGLSGGLWAMYGATIEPGASFVLDALDFDTQMRAARAVVTGEGRMDQQTLQGKLVGEIGTRTRQAGVPLHAIVGRRDLRRLMVGDEEVDRDRLVAMTNTMRFELTQDDRQSLRNLLARGTWGTTYGRVLPAFRDEVEGANP